MSRNEFVIAGFLGFLLLSGVAFESWQGGDKTAEVIITQPIKMPFESDQTPSHDSLNDSVTDNDQIISINSSQNNVTFQSINFLNSASIDQLKEIPGIGDEYAQRIIAARNQQNNFQTKEDVLSISGIGESKWKSITEFVEKSLSTPQKQKPFYKYNQIPIRIPHNQQFQNNRHNVKLNINQVSGEELQKIPGIGEVIATNIINARIAHNGFKSWDEILEVSGVGEKRLEEIQKMFCID